MFIAIGDDGTQDADTLIESQRAGGTHNSMATAHTMATDGSDVTLMGKVESSETMTFMYSSGNKTCFIMASEVY